MFDFVHAAILEKDAEFQMLSRRKKGIFARQLQVLYQILYPLHLLAVQFALLSTVHTVHTSALLPFLYPLQCLPRLPSASLQQLS